MTWLMPSYALSNGSILELDTCFQFRELQPPGFAVLLATEDELDAFWCATGHRLDQDNVSGIYEIGTCDCVEPEANSNTTTSSNDQEENDNGRLLGIMFSILSSFCTTFGTILQKYAHIVNDRKEKKAPEIGGLLISPWWLFALFIMVLLPLPFDFVAFSLAPQSLLVPFAGMTILLNAIFAPILLREKISNIEILATSIILLGLVIATASGPKSDVSLNACELLDRYDDADFLALVGVLLFASLVAVSLIHTKSRAVWIVRVRPVLYAFCAGAFGGIGNVFFKATGELAEAGISEDGRSQGAWGTVHPYYHIVLIIVFAFLQISHINQGLRRYNAVLFLPLYNTAYILLSGTVGAVVYHEFADFTEMQQMLFPVGIMHTLAGIGLMTLKTPGVPTNGTVTPLTAGNTLVANIAEATALGDLYHGLCVVSSFALLKIDVCIAEAQGHEDEEEDMPRSRISHASSASSCVSKERDFCESLCDMDVAFLGVKPKSGTPPGLP
ncbi:NIPA-like protein 2 [Hondaea fermentalgiana]|uniref:NIPA-like protein 2 n=1 Tax=Hondaea fermentalgiana TaxID=2315210 RepID=A0A2R5GJJ8_9STRA|nr:NIPA-like protein 2 [Hondaea fermentalgiana]|eukprot:GBG31062.1 NIPA-like protein 2 [Hondaea fermentalgiana]